MFFPIERKYRLYQNYITNALAGISLNAKELQTFGILTIRDANSLPLKFTIRRLTQLIIPKVIFMSSTLAQFTELILHF
jgi:hypothetical protein